MGKKLSWATIIIIVILSICVGIAGGILLSKKMGNSKIVKDAQSKEPKTQEETIIEPEKEKQTTKTEETLKYDGTKSITIGGKEYKISYTTEDFIDEEHNDQIVDEDWHEKKINLFLNDKKVKSFLGFGYSNNLKTEMTLHKLNNEYIVVECKTIFQEYEQTTIVVLNTEGECVDTLEHTTLSEYWIKKTGEKLTYEINDNNIITYEFFSNDNLETSGKKIKHTYIRDIPREEVVKTYDYGEIDSAGK